MALIVDASVAGSWAMPDEQREEATAIGRRVLAEGARAPDLFWHEIRNLLVLGVRRRRLTEDEFWRQFERIERMPISIAPTPRRGGSQLSRSSTASPPTTRPISISPST